MPDSGGVSGTSLASVRRSHPVVVDGAVEVLLVLGLWVAYSLSRLAADSAVGAARDRAQTVLALESRLGLAWERPLNRLVTGDALLGVVASYWYAALHYLVTGGLLVWLFHHGWAPYQRARRALALATLMALVAYLVAPTAPPRYLAGYADALQTYAAHGWWSTDASAPRGLGGLTNELAAFPSLHAGWALWVALVVQAHVARRWLRALGWTYALGTAVVVVGTGNHWVLDVLAGWLVVLTAWLLADQAPESRFSALRTTAGSVVVHIGGRRALRKPP